MKDFPIIIAAPVRDAERFLDRSLERLLAIADLFGADSQIILVESNSSDGTVRKLGEITSKHDCVQAFSLGCIAVKARTVRMAAVRNFILRVLREKYDLMKHPYVLFLDADEVLYEGVVERDGIFSCFDYTGWDMMCANQPDGYYDLWALRSERMPHDCWMEVYKRGARNRKRAIRELVVEKMFSIPEDAGIERVESAFGGAAFVRSECLFDREAPFAGVDERGWPVCEWVPFCRTLAVFINPRFVNYRGVSPHIKKIRLQAL